MAFGTNTVLTNLGRNIIADRIQPDASRTHASCDPRWGAIGKGATGAARTASCTDTALSCEIQTRSCGTISLSTITVTNDTYNNVGTITATSASSSGPQAVDEAGLFTSTTTGAVEMFASATFPVVNLLPGDSLQNTWKVQIT